MEVDTIIEMSNWVLHAGSRQQWVYCAAVRHGQLRREPVQSLRVPARQVRGIIDSPSVCPA